MKDEPPPPPIALPTEYQCVICGGKIRRIKGMTSLSWIKSVATWCQEHRQKHAVMNQPKP